MPAFHSFLGAVFFHGMVLKYEDLTDVILVGHSYGGMIIAAFKLLAH
ncbi:hypothetical protein ACFLYD_05845 [Chloroflexota bacterium]